MDCSSSAGDRPVPRRATFAHAIAHVEDKEIPRAFEFLQLGVDSVRIVNDILCLVVLVEREIMRGRDY